MNRYGMGKPGDLCRTCGKYPVETIEDWVSDYCGYCNDRLIEKSKEDAEWRYYHSEDKS